MAYAVEVDRLVKRYGDLRAVDGIDVRVPAGTVFAFLGPNGAGKTTTVEILEGLRQASEGSVRVLGLDPWKQGRTLHRRIGVIPQEFRFFEKVTCREAVEYYRALFGTRVDAAELLARVELVDKRDARFDTLSGGQKQKLGLALALSNEPEAFFLDEPTTGLDPHARRAIWNVVRSLRQEGRTVFLTTHYLEEAQILADRVAIIHHGRLIATGAPEEIIRRFGRPTRLKFAADPRLAEALRADGFDRVSAEAGTVEVELADHHDAVKVLEAVERSKVPWASVATSTDTLEDVFVRLVGRMDEGTLSAEASP